MSSVEFPVIDYEQGLARFLGNDSLYRRFLKKFLADGSEAAFQEALKAGELEKAEKDVHTLKGTAGNLSLIRLFHAADAAVQALREGQSGESVAELAAAVAEEKREACRKIQESLLTE